MAIERKEKTPEGDLDYGIDWANWLAQLEQIVSVVWVQELSGVVTTDLTLSNDTIEDNGTQSWTYIGGGVTGNTYTITAEITTDATPPRIARRSFLLTVRAPIYLEVPA